MTRLTDFALPPVGGRLPRIAFVVFNDTYHDTRVLKIAETAAQAGAEVRIFAAATRRIGFGPGIEAHPGGFEIERMALFSMGKFLISGGNLVRRVLGRPVPEYYDPRLATAGPAATSVAPLAPAPDDGPAAPVAGADSAAAAPAPESPAAQPSRSAKATLIGFLNRFNNFFVALSFKRAVAQRVPAWGPDLLHGHDAEVLSAIGPVAARLHVPFIYDSHELWTKRNKKRTLFMRLTEGASERRWSRRAARAVTVSPSIARWLKEHYRLRELPELVRNIPPLDRTPPTREQGRLRALAGLDAESKVVVYCGGITFNRGIEAGIEATAFLPADTHFVLLGHGAAQFVASLRELARARGVSGRVHFVPSVPSSEVSTTLADADVSLVLTRPTCLSYEYSLPNKLFESIHAGVPVLATRLVDAAALVEEHHVGETVAVDADARELAARIEETISRTDEYREAAAHAAFALAWNHEADRLVEVWARALGVTAVERKDHAA